MLSASVSNLDLYRMWQASEDLDLDWLLTRLCGKVAPTAEMMAGTALHSILENPSFAEQSELTITSEGKEYWFSVMCDIEMSLPSARELSLEKVYGDLLVRGRVDGLQGLTVIDYKTTGYFDADKFMEKFAWRYYLDALNCDNFIWKIFVLKPSPTNGEHDGPQQFDITQYHELTQKRYPGMADDCARLSADYSAFIKANAPADYLKSRERETV